MRKLIIITTVILLMGFTGSAQAITFTVDADLDSITSTYYQNIIPPYNITPLNTNLFLDNGDLLEVSASGTWSNAPTSYNLIFGPNGNPNENIAATYPGAGSPVAALMGRIGNNDYFFIGESYSSLVNKSGALWLGFNDTDYGNNWGTVNADVNITKASTPVPEPVTILLLGPALLGLLGYKWKRG
ncbi:MAG: hypothetical protein GY853_06110 [PVC group bacterium]|nr:hypothetical protein [PVC group bacterium]